MELEKIMEFFHLPRQPRRSDIETFITWAREHAVAIDPLDGLHMDIEKLSFLDALLKNKRIVYLGEEDHWIHEKSDYRLILLRYLISRGWRYIGEELGMSDGLRVDRYFETGDESFLERMATYGYKGALRSDRDDRATGIMKSSNENYPVAEFKSEQLRLTRALRDLSVKCRLDSDRVHFFGFDVDAAAGGGYEDIEELLGPHRDEPAGRRVLELLARVQGETLNDEIARLGRVSSAIRRLETDLKRALGEEQYFTLCEWVLTLRSSFEFMHTTNSATDYKALNRAMAAREEAMHRHVRLALSQMKPTDKLVLMGHNRHLSKEMGLIQHAGAAPPGGKRVPSIGTYINRLLPGQVFSIWQIHDHGRSAQPYSGLSSEYSSVPGSLNSILAKVGPNYLLPTAGAHLLERNLDIVGLYNAVYRTAMSRQADAIFFMREVSPIRL